MRNAADLAGLLGDDYEDESNEVANALEVGRTSEKGKNDVERIRTRDEGRKS